MSEEVVIRRTPAGWRVAGEDLPDLASAMVLADLLAPELPRDAPPPGESAEACEVARLRAAICQLEHALAHRVTVERAIGVVAERQRIDPRRAFERLRGAARSRGRRVHDLAHDIVASVTNPLLTYQLPEELAGRLTTRREAPPRTTPR